MSLRARLVAAVCVVSLVALCSAGIATYALFSQSQLRQIDDSLQRTHEPLETLIASEGGNVGDQLGTAVDNDGGTTDGGAGVTDADHDLDRSIEQLAPGQLVIVLDPSETVEVSVPAREPGHEPLSIDVADLTLPPESSDGSRDQPSYFTLSAGDDSNVRVRVSRLSDGSVLVIGLSLNEARESARRLVTIGAIVAAVSLIIAAVLGWLLVGVGLRPLREVEETALAIASGGDLDHEVPGENSQTEVGRLAAALNTMPPHPRGVLRARCQGACVGGVGSPDASIRRGRVARIAHAGGRRDRVRRAVRTRRAGSTRRSGTGLARHQPRGQPHA